MAVSKEVILYLLILFLDVILAKDFESLRYELGIFVL